MAGAADVSDDGGIDRSADDASRGTDLECVVVRYERRPDRCTLVPREGSVETQLTAWLTANRGAFVRLDEMQ